MLSLLLQVLSVASWAIPINFANFVEGQTQHNVMFLLVDDGGFESSVFGNPVIQTPNLERLAAKGTTFERAFTAVSSCSPSRSAILTGLPTHQNGMYGLHQYPGNFQSNADVVSIVNIFNAAGYKTGVGKHHIGPLKNYAFRYGTTAQHCWAGALGNDAVDGPQPCSADYNTVTRNITLMRDNAAELIKQLEPEKPFFLWVGWGDMHRCAYQGQLGSFCEFYGSGERGQEQLPDWTSPRFYEPEEVVVPPWLPDTLDVRADIAGQYTAAHRMDAGVGLLLDLLVSTGHEDDTLVVFFADNGIPFPSAKTNLQFEQGQAEPLIIASPQQRAQGGRRTQAVVSSLDFVPTLLDWARLDYPADATAGGKPSSLSGSSLLPLLEADEHDVREHRRGGLAFGSHMFHSVYAYYPTRVVRDARYRLVHNLAPSLEFAILEDVEETDTWRLLQNGSIPSGERAGPHGWIYPIDDYMRRPEYLLFDCESDPLSLVDLSQDPAYDATIEALQAALHGWRRDTHDPWLACDPPSTEQGGHSEVCSF